MSSRFWDEWPAEMETAPRAGPFFVFARHGHNLTGESPERGLIAASAQPKTRCQWRHWV